MTKPTNNIQTEVQPKKTRGGARPGSRGKKLYEHTLCTQRLKLKEAEQKQLDLIPSHPA